jgi:MFS family permease
MQSTSQGWLVVVLTSSPALLGLASAAATAPTLLLSLLAGVVADRVDKRQLLIVSQLAAAVLSTILALLVTTGGVAFWHVVVLAFLSGSVSALAIPSFQAIVSTIVDRGLIGSAIALNSAQFNLARVFAPALAGIAIAAGGLAIGFWANAVSFLVVAAVFATLPVAAPRALAGVQSALWSDLTDGLRFVARDRLVLVLVLLAAAPGLFILNYLALLPIYARDILRIGAPGLGALTGAIGLGALIGAVTLAFMRPAGGSGRLALGGLSIVGVALVVFGLSRWLPVSLIALAVLGAFQVAYYSTTNTLLQVLVPARLRGRVLSLYTLTSIGLIPIGNLAAGLVGETYGVEVALAGGGLICLVIVAVVAVLEPRLVRLRAAELARQADAG